MSHIFVLSVVDFRALRMVTFNLATTRVLAPWPMAACVSSLGWPLTATVRSIVAVISHVSIAGKAATALLDVEVTLVHVLQGEESATLIYAAVVEPVCIQCMKQQCDVG